MGFPVEPAPAVLISGILVGDPDLLADVHAELARILGPVALASDLWPFGATHYYADELGESIWRQFVAFAEPFPLDRLVEVKLATNALELSFASRRQRPPERRPVNLDPGYVTLSALVLATTKPRAHRIYLARGIYAEVTLNFESGAWRAWPWTYPDFAADTYHAFLSRVRGLLKARSRGA